MSNGRSEKRIARSVSVEVCLRDEAKLKERTLTENVSAHGARVLMEQKFQHSLSGLQLLLHENTCAVGANVFRQRPFFKLCFILQANFYAHYPRDPFLGSAIRHSPPGARDLAGPR